MNISIDSEKLSDNIQHFMKKACNKLTEEDLLNLIKGIYKKKSTADIILNDVMT